VRAFFLKNVNAIHDARILIYTQRKKPCKFRRTVFIFIIIKFRASRQSDYYGIHRTQGNKLKLHIIQMDHSGWKAVF